MAQLQSSKNFFDNVQFGLLRLKDDTNQAGTFMERTFKNIFENMEEGLTKFIMTGKAELSDLQAMLTSLQAEIIKMTIRKSISDPISEGLAGMVKQFAPLALSFVGMSTGTTGSLTPGATAFGTAPSVTLPTVAHPVGAMIPASFGDVRQPTNINMTIQTPDANSFMRNQGDIIAGMNNAISRGRRNL